jgi:hypothetical protein
MRQLEAGGVWDNGVEVQRLQSAVVDGVKQFEFGLRRDLLGAQRERLFLSGSEDVPEAYRKLVEEYYRSLSRERRDR